jgi:hypothetical protein
MKPGVFDPDFPPPSDHCGNLFNLPVFPAKLPPLNTLGIGTVKREIIPGHPDHKAARKLFAFLPQQKIEPVESSSGEKVAGRNGENIVDPAQVQFPDKTLHDGRRVPIVYREDQTEDLSLRDYLFPLSIRRDRQRFRRSR